MDLFQYWICLQIFRCCTLWSNTIFFSIKPFLYLWPRFYFCESYIITVARGYLHNHSCSTIFAIVADFLLLYFIISNHPVAGYIMVKYFSIRGSSWTSIIFLYEPIIYTNNLSCGMASVSLVGNWPYLRFCLLIYWQLLQTIIWVCMSPLKLGQ